MLRRPCLVKLGSNTTTLSFGGGVLAVIERDAAEDIGTVIVSSYFKGLAVAFLPCPASPACRPAMRVVMRPVLLYVHNAGYDDQFIAIQIADRRSVFQ